MAPPAHTQPTDDMVERAKRAVKRKMKPFEEAANSLSEYLKGEKAEIDEGEIRIDQLKHLYDDQTKAWDDLIALYENAPLTEENEDELDGLLASKRERVFLWLKVNRELDRFCTNQSKKAANASEESDAESSGSRKKKKKNKKKKREETETESSDDESVQVVKQKSVRLSKLPDLKLLCFYGNRMEWTRFWEVFESHVHKRTDLDPIIKFSHLVNSLKGEAAKFVAGYAITGANYTKVVEVLKKEYGRDDIIKETHFAKLLSLMERKPSTTDATFRELYIEASAHARALEALEVDPASLKSILNTVLVTKMPEDFKLMWYRSAKDDPTTEELFKFIDSELAARTRFKVTYSQHNSHHEKRYNKEDRGSKSRHYYDDRGSKAVPTMSALTAGAKKAGGTEAVPTASHASDKAFSCMFCSKTDHRTGTCSKNVNQRKEVFSKEERCYKCSRRGHGAKECHKKCGSCNGDHHVYLCEELFKRETARKEKKKASGLVSVACGSSVSTADVILQSFWVTATGPGGNKKVRVLLDGGAHYSYVTQELAETLRLQQNGVERQTVAVFGGGSKDHRMKRRKVYIRTNGGNTIALSCLEIPKICDPVPAVDLGRWKEKLRHERLEMAAGVGIEEGEHWDGAINILIGAHDYYSVVNESCVRFNKNLMAIQTIFGWILHGRLHPTPETNSSLVLFSTSNNNKTDHIDELLKKLFNMDAIHPLDEPMGGADAASAHFQKTMRQLENGQYQLRLPRKENSPHLPSNLNIAKKRATSLADKWKIQDPNVLKMYHDQIESYIKEGQVEEIPPEEIEAAEVHYLTSQAVVDFAKHTAVRPVFNASLGEPSLNDCLHTGPNNVPLMTDILMRMRLHSVVVIGDYRKAFLHIKIDPQDRNLLRFLWWEDPFASPQERRLRFLRWCVVVFGITCSPFQLEAVLTYHVKKYLKRFPRTARMMLNNTFVDDLVGGAESRSEAERFVREAIQIASEAGMKIQRWKTNDPILQKKMDEENSMGVEATPATAGMVTETAGPAAGPAESTENSSVHSLYDKSEKVMGVVFKLKEDVFSFETGELQEFSESLRHRSSLRTVLRISARAYDPFGFISPVTILPRMLMQKIWKRKLNWDEELPEEMKKEFWAYVDELKYLREISIPRHYFGKKIRPRKAQLHICCDASKDARGACAYLRTEDASGIPTISFMGSKVRVAPTNPISIARMELLGAVLAVRLAQQIVHALGEEIELEPFFWTDSMVVLFWVNGKWYAWKTYVGNRVKIIQENSNVTSWRHIAGKDNPADICSRGMSASKLVAKDCIWQTGPTFLRKPREQWPCEMPKEDPMMNPEVTKEMKNMVTALVAVNANYKPSMFNAMRYSTLETVLRMTAHIQIQLGNYHRTKLQLPLRENTVLASDLELAKYYWFRWLQENAFSDDLRLLKKEKPVERSSSLAIFHPFIDKEDGLIRLNARTKLSSSIILTPNVPILPNQLPGRKGIPHLIKLLVRWAHRRVCHSGATGTLAELRKWCWIIHGRQVVLRVLRKCVPCNKEHGVAYDQPTAPLPTLRCSFAEPFLVTGLDIAGPFYVREHRPRKKKVSRRQTSTRKRGRGRTQPPTETPPTVFKVWVLLFTCSTTRGLHLELLMHIDTTDIIMAVDRFVSRRGRPTIIYSDNGKQLLRASKDVAEMWGKAIPGVMKHAAENQIEWKFIVEAAPWWGGFWERLVGSTKRLLRRVGGQAGFTVKELETLLCRVEAALNSRPITYQYSMPGEPLPLTPNDLLVGQRPTSLPPRNINESLPEDTTRLQLVNRVKYRELVFNEWQRRWNEEYLQDRARHFNRRHKETDIKVGEVVLIEEENVKRSQWRAGVIEKILPSVDGVGRSVELRTATGRLNRPVQRLYAFELNEDDPTANSDEEGDKTTEARKAVGAEAAHTAEPDNNEAAEQGERGAQDGPADPAPPNVAVEPVVKPPVVGNSNNSISRTRIVAAPNASPDLPVSRDPRQGSVENRRDGRPTRLRKSIRHPDFVYSD